MKKESNINNLYGLVLSEIVGEVGDDEIIFKTTCGRIFKMYHDQDCCEYVRVEDIIGNLKDLIGSEIIEAEEVSSDEQPIPENADSYTWTFYKFGTKNGFVTIRWLGESNGYYSESVDFIEETV